MQKSTDSTEMEDINENYIFPQLPEYAAPLPKYATPLPEYAAPLPEYADQNSARISHTPIIESKIFDKIKADTKTMKNVLYKMLTSAETEDDNCDTKEENSVEKRSTYMESYQFQPDTFSVPENSKVWRYPTDSTFAQSGQETAPNYMNSVHEKNAPSLKDSNTEATADPVKMKKLPAEPPTMPNQILYDHIYHPYISSFPAPVSPYVMPHPLYPPFRNYDYFDPTLMMDIRMNSIPLVYWYPYPVGPSTTLTPPSETNPPKKPPTEDTTSQNLADVAKPTIPTKTNPVKIKPASSNIRPVPAETEIILDNGREDLQNSENVDDWRADGIIPVRTPTISQNKIRGPNEPILENDQIVEQSPMLNKNPTPEHFKKPGIKIKKPGRTCPKAMAHKKIREIISKHPLGHASLNKNKNKLDILRKGTEIREQTTLALH